MSAAMSHRTRTRYLHVGIVPFVLLTVFVFPAYGKPSSTVDPATKAKVAVLIEKLKDKEGGVRSAASAAGALGGTSPLGDASSKGANRVARVLSVASAAGGEALRGPQVRADVTSER